MSHNRRLRQKEHERDGERERVKCIEEFSIRRARNHNEAEWSTLTEIVYMWIFHVDITEGPMRGIGGNIVCVTGYHARNDRPHRHVVRALCYIGSMV